MSVGRRGFLRLIAAAPVAAPVIAREAATKAGIGVIGSAQAVAGTYGEPICGPSNQGWAMSYAKRVFSSKWLSEERDRFRFRQVGVLDPDLASSRSLSLSAAVVMQRERDFARYVERERGDAGRQFLSAFGFEFKP